MANEGKNEINVVPQLPSRKDTPTKMMHTVIFGCMNS